MSLLLLFNQPTITGNTGSLATTEAPDILAFSGTVLISGTLTTTESQDIVSFAGSVTSALTGTLATTERQDIALFLSDPIVGGTWLWKSGVEALQKLKTSVTPNSSEAEGIRKAAAILSKMGGEARAKALTATQRSSIATNAAKARWK